LLRSAATPPRKTNGASAWAPSGGSATAEVGMAAPTVARRARDAVRNDPYASRIVDLWTGNAVGAGITTRWPDQRHADAWRRWAEGTSCDAEGRLDLYGLQALVMCAVVESGECFVRFVTVPPSPVNPIGLRLQVLEGDHLDTARNGMVDGVLLGMQPPSRGTRHLPATISQPNSAAASSTASARLAPKER
jgi:capsid protein